MAPRAKQTANDFQARKKLLEAGSGKKAKKQATLHVTKKKAEASTTTATPASASSPPVDNTASNNALLSSGYGGGLGSMGMMGMGGMSMYGGGMYGSPYGMGMGGMGTGMGPLNSLNQFLFGIQTAIYSLSSAVQVIGMNTQAFHQLLDAASSMIDHALATWHEMRVLEATATEGETEEQKMRRRRLKALRYAMVVAATYAGYRFIRSVLPSRTSRRRRRIGTSDPQQYSSNYNNSNAMTPYNSGGYSPYSSGYGGSPYSSTGMYGAGAGYGMGYGGGFY